MPAPGTKRHTPDVRPDKTMKAGFKQYLVAVGVAYAIIQTSGLLICTAVFPFMEGKEDMPATVNAHAFMGAAVMSFTVVLFFTAVPTLLYAGGIAGFALWLRARRLTPWYLYPCAIVLTTLIVVSILAIRTGGRKADADVIVYFMAILLGPSLLGAGALHLLDLKQRRVLPMGGPHR